MFYSCPLQAGVGEFELVDSMVEEAHFLFAGVNQEEVLLGEGAS